MTSTTNERPMVRDLLPLLDSLGNTDLRNRVTATWSEAIARGNGGHGWTTGSLLALPFTLLAGEHGMRFIDHLNSCAEQCLAIADVLERRFPGVVRVDRDTLLAGALLADVGKLFEFVIDTEGRVLQGTDGELLRHPFTGVALASKHGLPAPVLHIIAAHSHEGDRVHRSIECIIFHHADFIDFDIARALGRGVAR